MSLRETLATVLPPINAALNATCAVLLFRGRRAIARGERVPHSRFMVSAFFASAVFLVTYLTRVYLTGTTPWGPWSWLKVLYLAVLLSHMVLAVVMLPMILRTLYLARSARFAEHRKLAAKTYPIWMYVSITGVVVYVMLYHLRPAVG